MLATARPCELHRRLWGYWAKHWNYGCWPERAFVRAQPRRIHPQGHTLLCAESPDRRLLRVAHWSGDEGDEGRTLLCAELGSCRNFYLDVALAHNIPLALAQTVLLDVAHIVLLEAAHTVRLDGLQVGH